VGQTHALKNWHQQRLQYFDMQTFCFQADRILLDQVEGLNPIKEKHQLYIDIQPVSNAYLQLLFC
jgi:hypothetical protein